MVRHALGRAQLETEIPLVIVGTILLRVAGQGGRRAVEGHADRSDFRERAGERAGLHVTRRRDAVARGPQEIVHVAVRQRGADTEVRHQLAIDAEHRLVGPRHADVGDLVVRRPHARVCEIDFIRSLHARGKIDLVEIGDAVSVLVDGVVVDVGVRLNRRDESGRAARQLRREHRIAGSRNRLARIVERVGDADPWRDVVERVRIGHGSGCDRRQQWETRYRRDARLQVRRRLAIEPDAADDRETVHRQGVGDEALNVARVRSLRPVLLRVRQHVRIAVPDRNDLVAGDLRDRIDRRLPPREAELQLVLASEVARVGAREMLQPLRRIEVVRVVPDAGVVLVEVLVEAADGSQAEAARNVGVPPCHEQVLPDDEVAFALVVFRRPRLVPRRLGRMRRARAAAELLLVAFEEGEVAAKIGSGLAISLERVVFQDGFVRRPEQRENPRVGLADRTPRPQLVLENRAAQVEPIVFVRIGAVPAVLREITADALRVGPADRPGERRIHVVRLQPLVLEVVPRVPVRRIASLLQHEVQLDARRRVLRVGAADISWNMSKS